MSDNTPLIAAISSIARRAKERREAIKEASRMLGESDDDHDQYEQDRLYRELSGRPAQPLPADDGLFFYPGVEAGIPTGSYRSPISEHCEDFFRMRMPQLFPEYADSFRSEPVEDLTIAALDAGMVAVFGIDDKVRQIMAKNSNMAIKSGQARFVKDYFPKVADQLIWLKDPTTVGGTISGQDAMGTHLKSWERA